MTPARRATLVLAGALVEGACQHRPMADPTLATPSARLEVRLPALDYARRRPLGVWVAGPLGSASRPLVVHLTGDSGRHGLDLELYRAVTRWGYPIAIVSSPDWIDTLPGGVATRESLARDIDCVSRTAARAAGVPEDRPLLLLGLSRGAGLAVEAAGDAALRERLLGVVALGLCPFERRVQGPEGVGRPYRDKALLDGLRLEVIQSTRDHYMSAAEARKAFGPDSGLQVLHPIEAGSHTFVGGRDALLDQLRVSLERVGGRRESATSPSGRVLPSRD